jgi:soluble lytic murein transglycosylase
MLLVGISVSATARADSSAATAGSVPADAAQQGDVQVARFNPGLLPEIPDKTVLPRPLSADDAHLYRRMFDLQAENRYEMVDRLARRVDNRILLGHLLAERYLDHPDYKSTYRELAAWLVLYGDHPRADKVYALAQKRRPPGVEVPRPLAVPPGRDPAVAVVEDGASYTSGLERPKSVARKVTSWRRNIPALIRQGRIDDAERELGRADVLPLLDDVELDIARWQVGRQLLAMGQPRRAYALNGPAAFRSAAVVPAMAWTAGLSAWRVKDYLGAQRFFTDYANRRGAVPADAAMGAFWAARASLAANRPQFVGRFMRLAAATGDNFYGRLAQAVLGDPLPRMSAEAGLNDRSAIALLKYAAGRRALALGQIDRPDLAGLEIASLAQRQGDPALAEAIWNLAEALDLPPEAAAAFSTASAEPPTARYPVPKLKSSHFELDRALVLAVIRAESGFDQLATSSAGARGLMQIMPETAAAIARRNGIAFSADDLHDPLVNLKLGQGYLKLLMAQKEIGPNLILLAAAYNAGPGRIIQWLERDKGIDDPLFFVESIPLTETRLYVKKVLSAYWAYQERFSQATTSLDELRLGSWPTYRDVADERQTASRS